MKKIVFAFLIFCAFACGAFFLTLYFLDSDILNKNDFIAESSAGRVKLSDFNGQYKIIYFGYTFCPDVCPLTLDVLNEALGDKEILLLFITLDPKRDTAQNLDEYAKFFYPNSIGLWLDEKSLKSLATRFGIKFEEVKISDDYYSIAHSSALFLLDKNGNLMDTITNLTKENIRDLVLKAIDDDK